ncbi:hypothetical protein [Mycobacterium sp.]|uniref:hypothetical protein n=1 Tax=Mycobacterium sp. TaxID=1785 RepID=UPI002D77022F|nr:hypothetical protein [Mycobacterium sp.]
MSANSDSPVTITISGSQVSSTANNIILTATAPGATPVTAQFTVVNVTISLNAARGATPAADDGKGPNYLVGAPSGLGAGIVTLPDPKTSTPVCAVGAELIGTVTPSNYTGLVTLRRMIANMSPPGELYQNQTQYYAPYFTPTAGHGPGQDDTSDPQLIDNDPQSGNSNGKVYDIDAPGIGLSTPDIYRYRGNFVQYAVLGDRTSTLQVGSNFPWWARVSCTQDAQGNLLLSQDVAGDNQAGAGTTPITWNLK